MAGHDEYGKRVLHEATRGRCLHYGSSVEVDYGTAQPARIDATVGDDIAVEVESRTSKQVRGAVLDLICHPYPKKLLLLLPVHMQNPDLTARQCRNILKRFCVEEAFRVIVLKPPMRDRRRLARSAAGFLELANKIAFHSQFTAGYRVSSASVTVG
jgi:hypothetical protein